jgi:hypothetical protein
MSAEFLDHGKSEEFTLAGVMQNVQANEARIKVLVIVVLVCAGWNRSRPPPPGAGKGAIHLKNKNPKARVYLVEMNYLCLRDDNLFMLTG